MTHLPLSALRRCFATEYEKIKDYDSFAVVRNPFQRFPSSVFQRLKMYSEVPLHSITRPQFKRAVDQLIEQLVKCQSDAILRYDLIHFQRQSTYVIDNGEQLPRALFSFDSMSDILEYIGRLVRHPAQASAASHENRSQLFKSGFVGKLATRILPLYTRTVKQRLPVGVRNWLNDLLLIDQNKKYREIFESQYVRQFICEYYRDDIELFDRVSVRRNSTGERTN